MSRAAASKFGSRLRGVVSRIVAAQRGGGGFPAPPAPLSQLAVGSGISSSGGRAGGGGAWASGRRACALSPVRIGVQSRGVSGFRLSAAAAGSPATSDVSAQLEKEVTGLEREELEGELTGMKRFDLDPPRGPFGTKEAPAIIESKFDWRIVGCSGGVGEEEHDVLWFKLKKGENYECPVCSQVFQLKSIPDASGGHH